MHHFVELACYFKTHRITLKGTKDLDELRETLCQRMAEANGVHVDLWTRIHMLNTTPIKISETRLIHTRIF